MTDRAPSDDAPLDWQTVERLVDAALDRPSAERESFVHAEAAGNTALRDAALAWLRGCETADGFLDAPDIGTTIGEWRLLGELGRGGMGTVYLAERRDAELPMRAALKMMQRSVALESDGVRRFRDERRILAGLSHPGIARILDGGIAAGGVPWYAMEYIDGARIDQWCDAQRLDVRARVRLLLRVADAVQHAHARLVVHRDLKPANVLVDAAGVPRLLDFGIAKLLTPIDAVTGERTATRPGALPMTPAYAAPEQWQGDVATIATDIYALGGLAYLLLTGVLPHDTDDGDLDALGRRVLSGEIERPSRAVYRKRAMSAAIAPDNEQQAVTVAAARSTTLHRLSRELRGDLDTIIARAMHLEPARRYPTADALADDLRRWLDGRPVRARPDTIRYRLHKLTTRNPAASVVSVLALVGAVAFTVITARQGVELRRQASRIRAERDKAEEVTRFLARILAANDPHATIAQQPTLREVLDRGRRLAEAELRGKPSVCELLLRALVPAYRELGDWNRLEVVLTDLADLQRLLRGPDDAALGATLHMRAQSRAMRGDAVGAERDAGEAIRLLTLHGPQEGMSAASASFFIARERSTQARRAAAAALPAGRLDARHVNSLLQSVNHIPDPVLAAAAMQVLLDRRSDLPTASIASVENLLAQARGDRAAQLRATRQLVAQGEIPGGTLGLIRVMVHAGDIDEALKLAAEWTPPPGFPPRRVREEFTAEAAHYRGDGDQVLRLALQLRPAGGRAPARMQLIGMAMTGAPTRSLIAAVDSHMAVRRRVVFVDPIAELSITGDELMRHGAAEASRRVFTRMLQQIDSMAAARSPRAPYRGLDDSLTAQRGYALLALGRVAEARDQLAAMPLPPRNGFQSVSRGWLGVAEARLGHREAAETIERGLAAYELAEMRGDRALARAMIAVALGDPLRAADVLMASIDRFDRREVEHVWLLGDALRDPRVRGWLEGRSPRDSTVK